MDQANGHSHHFFNESPSVWHRDFLPVRRLAEDRCALSKQPEGRAEVVRRPNAAPAPPDGGLDWGRDETSEEETGVQAVTSQASVLLATSAKQLDDIELAAFPPDLVGD